MSTCDTCRWWNSKDAKSGVCENPALDDNASHNEFALEIATEDPRACIVTGCKFGCIHHNTFGM